VQTLSHGPSGNPITASFKSAATLGFQDDVGALVLACAQRVPDGMLVFVASYTVLERLQARWETTGLWGALGELKTPVMEPRGSDKEEFEACLQQYYDAIEAARQRRAATAPAPLGDAASGHKRPGDQGVTGAVLFAVCRGKVSEGLDFSDHNAVGWQHRGICTSSMSGNEHRLPATPRSLTPFLLHVTLKGTYLHPRPTFTFCFDYMQMMCVIDRSGL